MASPTPNTPNPSTAKVAYLCTDLLFTSKIRESARGLGLETVAARDPAGLLASAGGASVVIVDLRRPDALEALDQLGRLGATATGPRVPRVIGFCDHERVELLEEARRRGCLALPKGKFSSELKHLLLPGDRG